MLRTVMVVFTSFVVLSAVAFFAMIWHIVVLQPLEYLACSLLLLLQTLLLIIIVLLLLFVW